MMEMDVDSDGKLYYKIHKKVVRKKPNRYAVLLKKLIRATIICGLMALPAALVLWWLAGIVERGI